jgi:cytoskeleton protein RodZ
LAPITDTTPVAAVDPAPSQAAVSSAEPVAQPVAATPSRSMAALAQSTSTPALAAANASSVTAQAVDSAAAPNPPAAPPLPTDGLMQVRVQETAWVQVTGASGRVLVQRELKSGEAVGFSSDLPFSVVLGRADVVQVNVRGQAMDLAPHTRSNVARFEVR